jgi:hypothetical protein
MQAFCLYFYFRHKKTGAWPVRILFDISDQAIDLSTRAAGDNSRRFDCYHPFNRTKQPRNTAIL